MRQNLQKPAAVRFFERNVVTRTRRLQALQSKTRPQGAQFAGFEIARRTERRSPFGLLTEFSPKTRAKKLGKFLRGNCIFFRANSFNFFRFVI